MKIGRFTRYFIYAAVALIIGAGLGEAVIALEILGSRAEVDNTLLQQRIAGAREIKQVLNTPLPPIEPLPPVTAQLANSRAAQMASTHSSAKNPWSKTNSLPPEALDAMAKSLTTGMPESEGDSPGQSRSRSASYSHSTRFDRAVGSGF